MNFELLSEKNFDLNFGSFQKSEGCWEKIDESVVDLLLYARFKDESKIIKNEILEGKAVAAIVGYIRMQTELEKCPLCGSSFRGRFYSISIVDNKTKVCPSCGEMEQLERFSCSYDK